jgi:hypothetical protein
MNLLVASRTPHVILNTPSDPARACAIANVGIKGMPPADKELGVAMKSRHT